MYAIALAAALAAASAPAPANSVAPSSHVIATLDISATDPAALVLEQARAAEAAGDLDSALQGYRRALRLQRAEGILPVAPSYGAAHVLTRQAKARDAAAVLEELAADANLLGDVNTEAQVLLDLIAIKVSDHRRAAARPDAMRLKELIADVRLTRETRQLIRTRLT